MPAFGGWDEAASAASLRAYLAEFISTLLFVFAGEGSVISYAALTSNASLTPSGLVGVALTHGFALFVAVSIAANISGGHVNPAVTFGLFVGGHITLLKGILYWVAQLLGAALGAWLLTVVTVGYTTSPHALSTGEGAAAALVLEIIITFGLVYTVYATAVDPRGKGGVGVLAPLAIGLIVAANILFAGAFDGGSMNPARSFGPALVAWDFTDHWIYWAGPLIGAAIAGLVYQYLIISPSSAHSTHEPLSSEPY